MEKLNVNYSVLDRFLKYVKVDTQSDPTSATCPSTEKQKNLARILVDELQQMGIADAHMDTNGYVYGTIASTCQHVVPVICFCSHMDTSPDCSGENVKPIVHQQYKGKDIVLPDDPSQVIRADEHTDLKNQIGNDIVTASGTTLLGADNKAGVAEIMDAAAFLMSNKHVKHGEIKILFTPDEEIGRGVDKVDLKKLNADYGYTVDGETAGCLEDETFSADAVVVTINGFSTHPGFAKNKMQSAIKIASEIISLLPKDKLSPESTENKEGFIHPISISGGIDKTTITFIIRDFLTSELAKHEQILKEICEKVVSRYNKSSFNFEVKEQYRNMKEILDKHPQIVENGLEAIKRAGLSPKRTSIRGGTDGSRLSYMGLPCPNIFAGEHAFHSKLEWVSVQDMQRAVDTLIHLAMIWEEKSR